MKTSSSKATGSVRWEGDATGAGLAAGTAILRITTETGAQSYFVRRVGVTVRLEALGSGKQYTVWPGEVRCTCPDHQYRGRVCKHTGGLKAALARVAG